MGDNEHQRGDAGTRRNAAAREWGADVDSMLFVGENRIDAIAPADRGLAYGDGLFETMRAWGGEVPWWDRHWLRLQSGAHVLGIALPAEAMVREAIRALLDGRDGVCKLLVTRGVGMRGYAPSNGPATWMLSRHDAPIARQQVTLRWCSTQLAIQPALAGIKHCNRLEQVLARAEWTPGETADEGLVLDTDGTVVSAVAGNICLLAGDRWLTPLLDRCGVRGVCRGWAMEQLQATETRITPAQVIAADALFVCNAVRGILEVERVGDRSWTPHPQVARLRQCLAAHHPAFAVVPETP